LLQDVEQRQNRALAGRCQLDADDVRAPPELHHRRRLEDKHLALERGRLTPREREPQSLTGRSLAFDRRGKPVGQVLWLGDRPPDLLAWVAKPPREAKLPAPVVESLESSVHRMLPLNRRSRSSRPDAARGHPGGRTTSAGTARAIRRLPAAARRRPDTAGAGHPLAPRPAPPPGGFAGAWRPPADSRRAA